MNGALALRQALSVSSDVFFYRLGQEANGSGDGLLIQKWASEARPRPAHRHRPARRGARAGADAQVPQRRLHAVPPLCRQGEADAGADLAGQVRLPRPSMVGGRQHQPGRGPGRPSGRPAADGRGLRRDRERRQGAATAPGAADRDVLGPSARRVPGAHPPQGEDQPRATARRSWTASAAPPASRAAPRPPVFAGFQVPIAGKTGTAEKGAGRADQSWYVALAPYPDPKYVVAVTFEAGGFGAETAAPAARQILVRAVRREGRRDQARNGSRLMGRVRLMQASPYGTSVKDFRDGYTPRFVRIDVAAAAGRGRPDGVQPLHDRARPPRTTSRATRTSTSRGRPPTRRSASCSCCVLSRIDYSRLREWRMGLYGFMIVAILAVFAAGSVTRGSKRAIELGFFQLQTLRARQGAADTHAVRLRGRSHAAPRGEGDHQPHHPAGADPGDARDRPAGPRLGPRLHQHRAGRAVRGRHPLDPLRGAGRPRRHGDRGRARRGPRAGRGGTQALPGGPPHGVREPGGEPRQGGLPADPVADRRRLRREDRPRRRSYTDATRLPSRAPHRFHLLGGGGGVRIHGRGDSAFAAGTADLAVPAGSSRCRRTSTEL